MWFESCFFGIPKSRRGNSYSKRMHADSVIELIIIISLMLLSESLFQHLYELVKNSGAGHRKKQSENSNFGLITFFDCSIFETLMESNSFSFKIWVDQNKSQSTSTKWYQKHDKKALFSEDFDKRTVSARSSLPPFQTFCRRVTFGVMKIRHQLSKSL